MIVTHARGYWPPSPACALIRMLPRMPSASAMLTPPIVPRMSGSTQASAAPFPGTVGETLVGVDGLAVLGVLPVAGVPQLATSSTTSRPPSVVRRDRIVVAPWIV